MEVTLPAVKGKNPDTDTLEQRALVLENVNVLRGRCDDDDQDSDA